MAQQKFQKKKGRSSWPRVRVEQPLRVAIVACACGNKYVKTRTGQSSCLRCMYGSH